MERGVGKSMNKQYYIFTNSFSNNPLIFKEYELTKPKSPAKPGYAWHWTGNVWDQIKSDKGRTTPEILKYDDTKGYQEPQDVYGKKRLDDEKYEGKEIDDEVKKTHEKEEKVKEDKEFEELDKLDIKELDSVISSTIDDWKPIVQKNTKIRYIGGNEETSTIPTTALKENTFIVTNPYIKTLLAVGKTNKEFKKYNSFLTKMQEYHDDWKNGMYGNAQKVNKKINDYYENKLTKGESKVISRCINISQRISEKNGSDYIYRGETDGEEAKKIVDELTNSFQKGKDSLNFKAANLSSWSENSQTASKFGLGRGDMIGQRKSGVLLRLSKKEYVKNTVFGYGVYEDKNREQEVTLLIRDANITVDDVFVLSPEGYWITLRQKLSGGD